ncbi:MAG: hypothetical protein JNL97_16980 [Verrucomicrobiales bacterium]|nr:hypothetical protein [Verrucomicrobiales bacterium]
MNAHLDPAQLARRLAAPDAPRLLDVRNPEEAAFASIPGSRLVPLGLLAESIDSLQDWRDAEIVVYCHHGVRSLHAIDILRREGFTKLINLRGGIDRWSVEVDPGVARY